MELLRPPFPSFTPNPNNLIKPTKQTFRTKVSIKPPPPEFNFKSDILSGSRAIIAEMHPELLDLADEGNLVLIEKNQFGPVPAWRAEFVEPEVIWLLGTNHVSEKSAFDVQRVVQAVKPDNVVVELCRSRAGIMYTTDTEVEPRLKSNPFSLSGSEFFGTVGRSINLGGQTALALRILLATFSSRISSNINRPFGDEVKNKEKEKEEDAGQSILTRTIKLPVFGLLPNPPDPSILPLLADGHHKLYIVIFCQFRAARKASEEISAQVVLGDRPIEITLQRAWDSLNWNEKLSLVTAVLRGITASSDQSKKELKESTTDDTDFQLYEQLSFSYPSLLQPLIHERDTYIAWSLKRSKAVRNSKRVVGIIGRGHLNGVIYALVSDLGDLRFRDLVGERPATDGSWVDTIVKSLVRDTIIGIVIWALYEQIKN